MTRPSRRTLAAGGAAVLATAGLVFAALPAQAVGSSTFEITDGNLVVNSAGHLDWGNVTQVRAADLPTGQNDNSFGNGTKEDTPVPQIVSGSIPNNKSDLKNFGSYLETSGSGHRYLNVYWTRVQEPTGTTNMDFEFNQSSTLSSNGVTPVRTAGDALILYDLSQGGTKPTIWLSRWVTSGASSQCEANNAVPCWGARTNLTAGGLADGSINTTAIAAADSDGLGALSARTFGEAQIDFDALSGGAGHCISFGSAYLNSRSSDSFTAAEKDFIAPVPESLSNCATVIIRKHTSPADSSTQFSFTKAFATDPASGNSFSLGDGQNRTYTNVLPGTGYTVAEGSLPAGWNFDSIDCSASSGVTPSIDGKQVTFAIDSASDVLDCTYNNRQQASLTVVKHAEGTTSQMFDFSSGTLSPSSFTLADDGTRTFDNLAPGGYDVSETEPAGWNLDSATCDNGDSPSSVTLHGGDAVTCTFTNVLERGVLLIHKDRKHAADGPGLHPQSGVDFTIAGSQTATTNAQGDACVTGLLPGDYTVTEQVPAGYHAAGDVSKTGQVVAGTTCATATPVSFVNIPLTNVSMSVDSQVNGGTSSTIACVDASGNPIANASTGASGDGSASASDLEPGTYTCTVVVDP